MNAFRQSTATIMFLLLHGGASTGYAGSVPVLYGTKAPPPVADCVIDNPWEGKLLTRIDAAKRLYTHPCNGGIYLADSALDQTGRLDRAVPVMQGWWLQEFISARKDGPESIEVHARFITGTGPTGSKPFLAGIRLRWTHGSWQSGEPMIQQFSKRPPAFPVTPQILEVTSGKELETLGLTSHGVPASPEVDFSGKRLVIYPVQLIFGAQQVTDLAVTQDGETYQIHFRIHGAQGMSFSRKTSLIWFTLPDDGMPVELYRSDRHTRAIPFHDFDCGIIDHGAIAPWPY